ncbi:MAG: M23 family metallopeptidase, partial [Gammaproteobacteria bacterium]|nr:M23 family metallopeptidase [Gammaproteobacteria bacterium]
MFIQNLMKIFLSPISGKIARLEKSDISSWQGLVIEGIGSDSKYSARILGIRPSVKTGDSIEKGSVLGSTQDPRDQFNDLSPYLHIELYLNGKRIDPTKFVMEKIKTRPLIHPGRNSRFNFKHNRLVSEALQLEKTNKHDLAIEKYKQSLNYPSWESSNTYVMHYIANNYAKIGAFKKAVIVQNNMLHILKQELNYALGNLPSKKLGIIAASNSEQSLRILISNHSLNLEAYKSKKQT